MTSPREQRKKRTRRAIVDAAVTLFSENGYRETSIEQIAKVAGVGKGTVYSYFPTKKMILRGFCEDELEHIHREIIEQTDPNTPVLDQMMVIYMTEFRHVTSNREFGRLFLREALFPADEDIAMNRDLDDRYFALIFPILERAQSKGKLRAELEPLHIIAHFYSLYLIIIHAWFTGMIPDEEIEESMRQLFRQAMEGLQPPADPSQPESTS